MSIDAPARPEVLSPASADFDRGTKFEQYKSIPGFAEYLLITQDRPHVARRTRIDQETWTETVFDALNATIRLETAGVDFIGDGGFHFSSPDSVFAVAQQYQIPILTVVLDNGGWQAVKSSVQRVYPKGVAAQTNSFQSQLRSGRQGEQRSFSDIGRAFGAHAEFVGEPDELAAAVDRCLAAVDGGIAAVLHVQITPL